MIRVGEARDDQHLASGLVPARDRAETEVGVPADFISQCRWYCRNVLGDEVVTRHHDIGLSKHRIQRQKDDGEDAHDTLHESPPGIA